MQYFKSLAVAACVVASVGVAQAASNVALGGTASQSSTYSWGNDPSADGAAKAIDGNTNGEWDFNAIAQTIQHTYDDTGNGVGNGFAWWQVALGGKFAVDSVVIWNRTDHEGIVRPRLNDFTVSLLDNGNTVWSAVYNDTNGFIPSQAFNAAGMVGDTVRIQQNRQEYLHMAEVQVLATAVPEPASAALLAGGLALVGLARRRRA